MGHCFAHICLSEEEHNVLNKYCDLNYDVQDDERISILRDLINKAFSDHQYIETEKDLKEMLINNKLPIFVVVKKYLGIND